jgi:hypothetical protein
MVQGCAGAGCGVQRRDDEHFEDGDTGGVSANDFSQFGTIVDAGGGRGLLLSAILRRATNSRGILFDAESVVEGAQAVLVSAGVSDRCAAIGGSFFESVPAGADAYVLKHIIHVWDDEKSLQILRNVRTAMNPDAKVLIVEAVVPTIASTCRSCSIWKCSAPPTAGSARRRSTPSCCARRVSASPVPFPQSGSPRLSTVAA